MLEELLFNLINQEGTSVKLKHNPNKSSVDGKNIILIDDSIVRGTTSVKIVQLMRDAGAKKFIC